MATGSNGMNGRLAQII